jgi:hypothetical protein
MIVSLRGECAPLERTMAGSERGPRSAGRGPRCVTRRDQRREARCCLTMQCVLTTRRSGSPGDRAAGYRKARAAALLSWSQALRENRCNQLESFADPFLAIVVVVLGGGSTPQRNALRTRRTMQ